VGDGGVEGEEEELLRFARKVVGFVHGGAAEPRVGCEVGRVEEEEVVPGWGPGFARGDQGGFEVFLGGGERGGGGAFVDGVLGHGGEVWFGWSIGRLVGFRGKTKVRWK
ncbi:hypothetical protein LTR33_012000, partial [Friedmanniomyces endolithicus]